MEGGRDWEAGPCVGKGAMRMVYGMAFVKCYLRPGRRTAATGSRRRGTAPVPWG